MTKQEEIAKLEEPIRTYQVEAMKGSMDMSKEGVDALRNRIETATAGTKRQISKLRSEIRKAER